MTINKETCLLNNQQWSCITEWWIRLSSLERWKIFCHESRDFRWHWRLNVSFITTPLNTRVNGSNLYGTKRTREGITVTKFWNLENKQKSNLQREAKKQADSQSGTLGSLWNRRHQAPLKVEGRWARNRRTSGSKVCIKSRDTSIAPFYPNPTGCQPFLLYPRRNWKCTLENLPRGTKPWGTEPSLGKGEVINWLKSD